MASYIRQMKLPNNNLTNSETLFHFVNKYKIYKVFFNGHVTFGTPCNNSIRY